MPVALYTVASGGTGRGAVTGSSPHAIITATPASPIHLVVRIALSHVGRFPPHDAKSMDGRWAGASDQGRCRRGILGNPHVGRGLDHDGSTIQMKCAVRSSRGEAAVLTAAGAGTCPTSSGSPGSVARVERSGCLPPRDRKSVV